MKRRTSTPKAPLGPNAIRILLDGWGAPVVESDPDPFEIFDLDLRETWRTHRAFLMAEWQRRGSVGLPWAARQFEETAK